MRPRSPAPAGWWRAAGLIALVFDHRGFGDSGGEPDLFEPARQLEHGHRAAHADGVDELLTVFVPALFDAAAFGNPTAALTIPSIADLMGMRVGVGQSLRYLQKNRAGLTKLVAGTAYYVYAVTTATPWCTARG